MLLLIFMCIVSSIFTVRLTASLDELNLVKYVGCMSSTSAHKKDLGHSFHPFNWEGCVLLCQSKGSRYAGLIQRKRMCFCGSYLLENSKRLQPKDCPYSCKGNTRRSCGGERSMTVYQLKEDDLPRILIATSNSIAYVWNNRLIPLISMPGGRIHGRIRYHYKYNEIYFNAETSIFRSQYSTVTNRYDPATPVNPAGKNKPYAVDWVNDRLYYTRNYRIWEASLNGTNLNVMHRLKGGIESMEIDPYERKLFYSNGPSLKVLDLKTKVETIILKRVPSISFPAALNVHTQTIYGTEGEKLMEKNYGNGGFRVAFHAPSQGSISDVMAVDEENIIFIQNTEDSLFVQYKFKMMKLNLKSDEYRGSLAIHEQIQAPTKKIACYKISCSHECQYSPKSSAYCLCPSEMQLDTSGRRCRNIRPSHYSIEEADCEDYEDCSDRTYTEEDTDGYSEINHDDSRDYYERRDDYSRYFSETEEANTGEES